MRRREVDAWDSSSEAAEKVVGESRDVGRESEKTSSSTSVQYRKVSQIPVREDCKRRPGQELALVVTCEVVMLLSPGCPIGKRFM